MTCGPLLLVGAVALGVGVALGAGRPRTWLALTIAGTAALLLAAVAVLAGGDAWEWRSAFPLGGEFVHLRIDALSAVFLALLAVVGGAGAIYAHDYWSDAHQPDSAPRGRAWWSALVGCMTSVLLASNGLHFLIAWELFAICGFFLITLDRSAVATRRAGWLYLAASHAGTLCLFAFFTALAARTGSWDLGPMRDRAALAPLFWLALAGFGVKAGLFPLHVWLPSAHANAPSHVSAIFSGVALKLGIYGLLRFSGWLPTPAAAGWVVLGLGATGAVLGIAFALAQNDLKRLLAYCSVENIGVILTGLGGALLAAQHGDPAWGRLALAGALLHVWNHGLFKSLLFLGAGSVLHTTGTRELSRLGGLWRTMPWTAACFAVGAVAVSGLPPLNGFVSEWLIYLGLFDAVGTRSPAAWAAAPAVILLGVAGALALASFVKAAALTFLGAPRTRVAQHAHECSRWMRGPMLALAGGCLALAFVPVLVWPALARASAVWRPAWEPELASAPLVTLEPLPVVLAALALLAFAVLWRRSHRRGLRRGPTWDCGYAAPTAHMQYSGGSLGATAAGWFRWALQPERQARRPRGLFPANASVHERTPETVLEHVVAPVGGVILQVSAVARRLQHGRLQFYVVYLAAGLTAVGLLVWLGGSS